MPGGLDCAALSRLLGLRNGRTRCSLLLRHGRLGLRCILLLRWGKNGVQDRAFHARHELDDSRITDVLNKAVDDVVTELAVGHLAAAEAEAGFHLVAIGEEADGLILLGLVVVLVHGHGELDFLDGDNFLLLSGGTLALFLLVEIAAIVLNAADGRDGSGRNFDQVKAAFAGNLQRLKGRQDAELFAVFVNHANFACANAVVDSDK